MDRAFLAGEFRKSRGPAGSKGGVEKAGECVLLVDRSCPA